MKLDVVVEIAEGVFQFSMDAKRIHYPKGD
jgi:hypothetical protein